MDIYLFAAQLLGLVTFLVDVEVASQMLVKMLQEKKMTKKKIITENSYVWLWIKITVRTGKVEKRGRITVAQFVSEWPSVHEFQSSITIKFKSFFWLLSFLCSFKIWSCTERREHWWRGQGKIGWLFQAAGIKSEFFTLNYSQRAPSTIRPFPSWPKPLFQSEAKSKAIDMKIVTSYCHTKKIVFTRNVLHLALFWKWEFLELGNGLLSIP